MPFMIVTIDGSAGSGKSTAARGLATRLKLPYLDTGAMYRAVGHEVVREGAPLEDAARLEEVARRVELRVDCGPERTRVFVDGRDISDVIRTIEVSRAAAAVAMVQPIRERLIEKQRAIGASLGSLVTEGRDQGSVVFPGADVKFVVDAAPERRAQRRREELLAEGNDVSIEDVLADVQQRDTNDSRQWAPLLTPGAAILIDTTEMSIAEVIDAMERGVRSRGRTLTGSD